MNCAKCGLDLPQGTRQCPKCGTVNEFIAPPPSPRKVKPAVYIIAALAAIAILALVAAVIAGRGNRNVVSAPGPEPAPPGTVTSAPQGTPQPGQITSAPTGTPAPPQTGPATPEKPKPPQEVVDYLAFCEQAEKCRRAAIVESEMPTEMLEDFFAGLADAFPRAGNPDLSTEEIFNFDKVQDKMTGRANYMFALLDRFDKYAAPASCREFSGKYRELLFVETDLLYSMAAQFRKGADAEWSKIHKEAKSRQSEQAIRDANSGKLADDANAALDRLVANYDMERPFEVSRERPSGGGIMGAPSPRQ